LIKIGISEENFDELSKIKYIMQSTSVDSLTMNDVIVNLIKKYKKI